VSYTPNDLTVYSAAYSGAIAGFAASGRWIEDPIQNDYSGIALIVGAFAQEFDTQWAISPDTIPPNTLQVFIIEKACKGVWENRDAEVTSTTLNASEYTEVVLAIIALIKSSDAYVTAQGITPNPWPTSGGAGTVTSVSAGTGISITGSPTVNPTVNNTGVLTVTAGTNVTVTGTSQNPIINATGTLTGLTAGTAISITGEAPSPTVNNTGVTSLIAGTGIGVSGATGAITVSNTGVLALTAGTNITIGGTASNPVINSTAGGGTLTGITAGTGISVTGGAPSPTVTNTGVTAITAGTGIGISGGTGNVTITANRTSSQQTGGATNINDGAAHTLITIAGESVPASGIVAVDFFVPYTYGGASNTSITATLVIDGTPTAVKVTNQCIDGSLMGGTLNGFLACNAGLSGISAGAHTFALQVQVNSPGSASSVPGGGSGPSANLSVTPQN